MRAAGNVTPDLAGGAGPRRVVHVVIDLHEGGLERVVTDLLLAADPARTDSRVVCLRRRGQLADELSADRVLLAPPSRPGSLALPLGLARTLRSLSPDLIHLHSGVWFKAAYASRLSGLGPVLFTDHGRPMFPDPLSGRIFDAMGAVLTDRVVAVSQPLADYLRDRLHVPAHKLRVVPNGIRVRSPASPAEVGAVRGELGLEADVPVLGTLGRLDGVKAQNYLLTSFRALLDSWGSGPAPVLLIAGDGPERERLQQQATDLGLSGAVRFLGWRTDIAVLLALFDLFLLTSDSEGTSISLLEAMGAGRAVLATAVGGTPDVLGPERAGQLVTRRDVPGLVSSIRAMLHDPARRQLIGAAGRARVLAEYSVDAMVARYDTLYDEVLAGRR
jgi:glycosyltransferase involved in cell wall biosynthesis